MSRAVLFQHVDVVLLADKGSQASPKVIAWSCFGQLRLLRREAPVQHDCRQSYIVMAGDRISRGQMGVTDVGQRRFHEDRGQLHGRQWLPLSRKR